MSFKALFFSIFVVSVSFVPFAKAGTSSFTYNDDLVCSYPFEQFVIDSLTCAPTSYIKFQTGNEYRDYAEDFSTCSFGDEMDISGRVTIEQAVARKYFLTLQACFQYSDSWYGSRKCSSFRVPLDLVAAVESTNNNGGQSSENYVSYLEAGNYAWSARLLLPKKTMSFGSNSILFADLKLTPGGKSYQADSYRMNSDCTATFSASDDGTANGYQTRYSAAAGVIFAGVLVGAILAGTHKHRRRLVCLSAENLNEKDLSDGDDVVAAPISARPNATQLEMPGTFVRL